MLMYSPPKDRACSAREVLARSAALLANDNLRWSDVDPTQIGVGLVDFRAAVTRGRVPSPVMAARYAHPDAEMQRALSKGLASLLTSKDRTWLEEFCRNHTAAEGDRATRARHDRTEFSARPRQSHVRKFGTVSGPLSRELLPALTRRWFARRAPGARC